MTELITKIDGIEKRLDNLEDNMNRKLDHVLRATARQSVILEDLVKVSRPMEGLLPRTDFTFVAMKSEEELQNLEELLEIDADYRLKLIRWLQLQISREDIPNRIHDLIDLLFSKPFFATLNWTGISKKQGITKIGLSKFKYVIDLFVEIACNRNLVVDRKYVATVLSKKLSHASDRIHLDDSKRTSCHTSRLFK